MSDVYERTIRTGKDDGHLELSVAGRAYRLGARTAGHSRGTATRIVHRSTWVAATEVCVAIPAQSRALAVAAVTTQGAKILDFRHERSLRTQRHQLSASHHSSPLPVAVVHASRRHGRDATPRGAQEAAPERPAGGFRGRRNLVVDDVRDTGFHDVRFVRDKARLS